MDEKQNTKAEEVNQNEIPEEDLSEVFRRRHDGGTRLGRPPVIASATASRQEFARESEAMPGCRKRSLYLYLRSPAEVEGSEGGCVDEAVG